jgi:hypothetical protein
MSTLAVPHNVPKLWMTSKVRTLQSKVSQRSYNQRLLTCVDEPTAALKKERTQNAHLQKRIEEITVPRDQEFASGSQNTEINVKPVPRPGGTAGTHFSIQEAMGLAGSKRKYETYKAIQVGDRFRGLFLKAGCLPW